KAAAEAGRRPLIAAGGGNERTASGFGRRFPLARAADANLERFPLGATNLRRIDERGNLPRSDEWRVEAVGQLKRCLRRKPHEPPEIGRAGLNQILRLD